MRVNEKRKKKKKEKRKRKRWVLRESNALFR